MNAVEKIAKLENVAVNVKVSQIAKEDKFIAQATLSTFNPEVMVTNGGPVTEKAVTVEALSDTYDNAYNAVLERAVSLFGL